MTLEKLQYFDCTKGVRWKSPTTLHVLAMLYHYADGDLRNARPGVARLAEDCCVDERTVKRQLRLLESGGFIRKQAGGYRGHASVYELRAPAKDDTSCVTLTPAKKGDNRTPKGDNQSEKGDNQAPKRVTPAMSPHQTKTRAIHQTNTPCAHCGLAGAEYDDIEGKRFCGPRCEREAKGRTDPWTE